MSFKSKHETLRRALLLLWALPSLLMAGCSAPMAFGGSNSVLQPPGGYDVNGSGQSRLAGRQTVKFNPGVSRGMEIVPVVPWGLRVEAGACTVNGKLVAVSKPVLLTESAPEPVPVKAEPVKLVDNSLQPESSGGRLQSALSHNFPVPGALDTTSVKVWSGAGSDRKLLQQDLDYTLNVQKGELFRKAGGVIPDGGTVYVDYQVRQVRLDTIEVKQDGSIELKQGIPVLTAPVPAATDAGALALATVFLDYGDTKLTDDSVFPIGSPYPEPSEAERTAMIAAVSHTRAKLLEGEPVTIVFWGEDVDPTLDAAPAQKVAATDTAVSNDAALSTSAIVSEDPVVSKDAVLFKQAPLPEAMKTSSGVGLANQISDGLAAVLVRQFKGAKVTTINVGPPISTIEDRLPSLDNDVLSHHPDLVIIESAADMLLQGSVIKKDYTDAVNRIKAAGSEVVLATPFQTAHQRPQPQDLRKGDSRANVEVIRSVARAEEVGLADVSRRWEHLAAEGIPYTALLANGSDLPDSRGRQIYVDALDRFF